MKVLVTGAGGQLGLSLNYVLERTLPGITVCADRNTLDITCPEKADHFIRTHRFTHIINCAAYTAVDKAETEKEKCNAINTVGAQNIATIAKKNNCRLIHLSTDYVFPGTASQPYTETDVPSPCNFYGLSKLEGEQLVTSCAPDSIIIRTGWLYSPYGNNFLKTVLNRITRGLPMTIVNDQTGTPTSAIELAKAIKTIITAPTWTPGIYNFSNSGHTTWYGFANEIAVQTGIRADISPCSTSGYPTPARRPAYSVLDTTKISQIYQPEILPWQQALADCLEIKSTL